jgi:hypothetical protein
MLRGQGSPLSSLLSLPPSLFLSLPFPLPHTYMHTHTHTHTHNQSELSDGSSLTVNKLSLSLCPSAPPFFLPPTAVNVCRPVSIPLAQEDSVCACRVCVCVCVCACVCARVRACVRACVRAWASHRQWFQPPLARLFRLSYVEFIIAISKLMSTKLTCTHTYTHMHTRAR